MKHHIKNIDPLFECVKAEVISRSEEMLEKYPEGFPFLNMAEKLQDDIHEEVFQMLQYMAFEKGGSYHELIVKDAS